MIVNPVIGREITERLRGLRAFIALSAFVLVLTLTAFLVYEAAGVNADAFDLAARTRVGRQVFESVILIMTVLVLFFVPGIAAGAIAGERERQTLATLQVTMLRPRSILSGKVVATVAYLGLLVVAAMPVLAVAYLLGGIRVVDIVRGLAAVLLVALLLATMVVAISAFAKRVQTATVLAYAFTVLLVIAGPLGFGVGALLDARSDDVGDRVAAPAVLLTVNPIVLVSDIGAGTTDSGGGPLSAVRDGVDEAKEANDDSWVALFPNAPDQGFDNDPLGRPRTGLPAWLLSTLSLAGLAALLFWGAARRLRAPAEVER